MILFINRSNNCYLISVMQAIFAVPVFARFLKNSRPKNEIVELFSNLINHVTQSNKIVVNSDSIMKILGKYDSFFDGRHQEDAHECMIRLFDILIKEYKNKAVYNKFTIHFKTTVRCNKCDYLNNTEFTDQYAILNYPTKKNKFTLSELFQYYLQEELLESECEKCRHVSVSKCTKITKLPQVLIIVFSKFNQLNKGVLVSKKININLNGTDYLYILTSRINHTGTLNSGHYTADVFNTDNNWYNFNDDTVHRICQNEYGVYDSNCYIAIYSLKS